MPPRISLASQIAAIEVAIAALEKSLAGAVAARLMSRSQADLQILHANAALLTLQWLQKNETKIKAKAER